MRDFFITILALLIIVSSIIACFFGLSILGNFAESIGISDRLVYFLAGFCAGIYRKEIWRNFSNFCESVWIKLIRI
tara:strand:+ start:94 stop:321 length:228 start_codon:yes stop_codon:yes gene_type:complete